MPVQPPAPPANPRPLGRGDLRWLLLWLLGQRAQHGYELIQQVGQMFAGRYSPSAGSVYPLLAEFEQQQWAQAQAAEGRKCYRITAAGRAHLAGHDEAVQAALLRARHSARQLAKQQLPAPLRQAMSQLTGLLLHHHGPWPDEQVAAAAALIEQAARLLQPDATAPR